jgi:hypothetical protein
MNKLMNRRGMNRMINPNLVPINDLIGSPDSLSNLRPVYYAPLFPSLHQTSIISPNKIHPYSLAEFPITTTLPQDLIEAKLFLLKKQLHAQDLEWRLTCYRIDSFNQQFWSKTNKNFLLARDRYLTSLPPSTTISTDEVDLSLFYAHHLDATKPQYAAYNRQLWRLQIGLLWPALKAAIRPWKWAWAVKRAGGERNFT